MMLEHIRNTQFTKLTRNTVDSNNFYSIETFILYLAVKSLHIKNK